MLSAIFCCCCCDFFNGLGCCLQGALVALSEKGSVGNFLLLVVFLIFFSTNTNVYILIFFFLLDCRTDQWPKMAAVRGMAGCWKGVTDDG